MRTRRPTHGTTQWGLLFVLPFLVLVGTFQLVPIGSTVVMAFTDHKGASPEEHWVGFDNFANPGSSFDFQGLTLAQAQSLLASLTAAGLDAFSAATSPGNSGLVFDRFFWTAFRNTLIPFAMSFVLQFLLAMLFAVTLGDTGGQTSIFSNFLLSDFKQNAPTPR
jgi:ABC-type sugar transport system permease subunit